MENNFFQRSFLAVVLALLGLSLIFGSMIASVRASSTGPGAPVTGGTVAAALQRTYYISPITGTDTIYASTARETGSGDMHLFRNIDVFASVDVSGTGTITVTPQLSVDNVHWVTATYGLAAATTVTQAAQSFTYQIVLDADGETDYFRMPMVGYYLRFSMEYTTTGTITPTVRIIGRND